MSSRLRRPTCRMSEEENHTLRLRLFLHQSKCGTTLTGRQTYCRWRLTGAQRRCSNLQLCGPEIRYPLRHVIGNCAQALCGPDHCSPGYGEIPERISKIHRIFERYTSLIEPLSLDEAYLDVTECSLFGGDASAIARAIRDAVRSEVGITISAGIAPNKFLAKIASDWNKPDGQFTVSRDEVEEFLTDLPVRKLHGVGKVTAEKMANLGIGSCGDLRLMELSELRKHFGSFGERLKQLSAGIDHRRVQTERIENQSVLKIHSRKTFPL